MTLPPDLFLNTPLVDRRITFYPGRMPFTMRLRFAAALVLGLPVKVPHLSMRVDNSSDSGTTPSPDSQADTQGSP